MEQHSIHQELATRPVPTPSAGYVRGYATIPYISEGDLSTDSEPGGLIDYWRMLRRQRGALILALFLGLAASVLFTLPQTRIYRARTAVEIQNVNSDFLNTRQVNPVAEDSSSVNALTDVQTQMKIIGSEYLVDRVIDKFKSQGKLQPLERDSDPFARWRQLLNLPHLEAAEADYKMRQRALKDLTVRQVGQTRVIEIFFASSDRRFAADFVNSLVSEYIESNMETRWKMSEHTGEWLSHQLEDMRAKLERSEDALEEYARRSGLLFTAAPAGNSEKTNVSEDKLRQVQQELSKAQADRAAAQSRWEVAQSARLDTLADVLNDKPLRDLQQKLTDLRRQEAELIAIYTAKHEKVRRVQAQIAPLEAEFAKEREAILDRIHNDFETALRRQRLLESDYASQTRVVTEQADKSIQYNILKRDVDSSRQLYESMLQQVKEASVASAIRASNVRVVDPAKTPVKPYSPDYLLNTSLGLLAGLLIGVAFIVARQRADHTLQEPGDTHFWTNLPELGVVPSKSIDKGQKLYGKQLPLSDGEAEPSRSVLSIAKRRLRDSVELFTWYRKHSLVAEGFRTVLTSIMFAGENGSRPRVLVFTSGSPMEGKSTVVSNLGIAMAEIQQKVLIIDADLRKPRAHQIFDLPNERGLSTLLDQSALSASVLDELIQSTSIPGLHILPSGPPTYAAANLLYSPHLRAVLSELKTRFDMILIDTPPSLQMTDARIIGNLADGVILVMRAGRTTRDAALAVQQRFTEDRITILGTILNDWNPKKSPGGYYGYYRTSHYGGSQYRYQQALKKTGS